MGRRPSLVRKERRHVHLHEGDWDWLTQVYGPQRITPSGVIAELVRFHRKRVEEKANLNPASLNQVPDLEDDSIDFSNVVEEE